MRIVGGKYRGSHLKSPKDDLIRPTADRVRESLFNILSHRDDFDLHGAKILDLFCGTGALGIESLSRGAELCVFVDQAKASLDLCRHNYSHIVKDQQICIPILTAAHRIATHPKIESMQFDLVFMDPPYGKNLTATALSSLHAHHKIHAQSLIVIEMSVKHPEADPAPDLFETLVDRTFGSTRIKIYRPHKK